MQFHGQQPATTNLPLPPATPAFAQGFLARFPHPLTKPIGRGLADLQPGALGCFMPGKSLLHSLNDLYTCPIQVGLFHENCSLPPICFSFDESTTIRPCSLDTF